MSKQYLLTVALTMSEKKPYEFITNHLESSTHDLQVALNRIDALREEILLPLDSGNLEPKTFISMIPKWNAKANKYLEEIENVKGRLVVIGSTKKDPEEQLLYEDLIGLDAAARLLVEKIKWFLSGLNYMTGNKPLPGNKASMVAPCPDESPRA